MCTALFILSQSSWGVVHVASHQYEQGSHVTHRTAFNCLHLSNLGYLISLPAPMPKVDLYLLYFKVFFRDSQIYFLP